MSNNNMDFSSNDKSHGAVIIFPDGMTKKECNDILKRMMKAGYCKPAYDGNAPTCHEFDDAHGSPVWYIP